MAFIIRARISFVLPWGLVTYLVLVGRFEWPFSKYMVGKWPVTSSSCFAHLSMPTIVCSPSVFLYTCGIGLMLVAYIQQTDPFTSAPFTSAVNMGEWCVLHSLWEEAVRVMLLINSGCLCWLIFSYSSSLLTL